MEAVRRAGTGGYSSRELIEAAAAQGLGASPRMIAEWVQQGLLAPPVRIGLGRGRGTAGRWPEMHVKVWLTVLRKREPQGKSPATLANIPVWFWLRWGEAYVPVEQVRRAMRTWVRKNATTSARAARDRSRATVAQIAHPSAKGLDRRRLEEALTEGAVRGRLHMESIGELARRVSDPHATGVMQTLELAPLTDSVLRLFDARCRAVQLLDELKDEDLGRVRLQYLGSREAYDTRRGFADPDDLQDEVRNACLNVLTLVGLTVNVGSREEEAESS